MEVYDVFLSKAGYDSTANCWSVILMLCYSHYHQNLIFNDLSGQKKLTAIRNTKTQSQAAQHRTCH